MRRAATATAGITVFLALALTGSAQGAFPGQNGKIAFTTSGPGGSDIHAINPDGTADANLTPGPCCDAFHEPAWSPDGLRLSMHHQFQGVMKMNSDGSGMTSLGHEGTEPAWSPDALRIAYVLPRRTDLSDPSIEYPAELRVMNADGTGDTQLVADGTCAGPLETDGPCTEILSPAWSPDGTQIAFIRTDYYLDFESETCFVCQTPEEVWFVDPDVPASDVKLQGGPQGRRHVDWHPNGSRLLVSSAGLVSMNVDGSGQVSLGAGYQAAWSPDGTRIVYQDAASGSAADVFTKKADGTDPVLVRTEGLNPDWQPIPVNAYPRPRGATPLQVSLVPAYAACTASDRTHGPPLAFPSCSAPAQTSDELTVGTADSNGKPTKSLGYARYDAIAGQPATPADEADVQVTVDIRDIYEQGLLSDYAGELRARVALRITDKLNTPHPGGPGAATVSDIALGATVPCAATPDPTEGARCTLATTFDAMVPGTVPEGRRSIWALGAVQLDDGGADSDADTVADNTLFTTQGIFIP